MFKDDIKSIDAALAQAVQHPVARQMLKVHAQAWLEAIAKFEQSTIPAPAPLRTAGKQYFPNILEVMGNLRQLEIGDVTIVRKNGVADCWIKVKDIEKVAGLIHDDGKATTALFPRVGLDLRSLISKLEEIELDPRAAAVLHGKASGRCSVCSRDLTNPQSIEMGLGPTCATKMGMV